MENDILYQAGEGSVAKYAFLFHFGRAGFSPDKSAAFTRFVEFWCRTNCRGDWHVAETEYTMSLTFANDYDVTYFHLSDEYECLVKSRGLVNNSCVIA